MSRTELNQLCSHHPACILLYDINILHKAVEKETKSFAVPHQHVLDPGLQL